MTEERLLTVAQVAARLQTTEETVRDWLTSGRLRGYRPGGKRLGWRISEEDLRRFLDQSANRPDGGE
jgi:excisionase family DNA binding protein